MAELQGKFAEIHARNLRDPAYRRAFERERLIVDATEDVRTAIECAGLSRANVAERLGVSRAHVTQVLNGHRNMTLNTLSDLCWAAGHRAEVHVAVFDAPSRYVPLDGMAFVSPPRGGAVVVDFVQAAARRRGAAGHGNRVRVAGEPGSTGVRAAARESELGTVAV